MTAVTPQDIWAVLQPYLPLLLAEAAKESGKKLPAAVGKLWAALRARLERKPAAKEALDDLTRAPDDPDFQAAFRVQLRKALSSDPAFAAQLAALLQAAGGRDHAELHGDGAIAQDGSTAVGKGGVYIGGNASGNTIVTGDDNRVGS